MNIISALPQGFQKKYFRETESETAPQIRRQGMRILFPAFIRMQTVSVQNEERTVYHYFQVPVTYTGQDLSDYEAFAITSYAAIRKFFYGPPDVQNELRDDFIWEAHRQSVRSAFPKKQNQVNALAQRFTEIKNMFWNSVDTACALVGKTRQDLPQHFNAQQMLAWAQQNGMPQQAIATYSQIFSMISLNLLQNNRNWDQMFT